MAHDSSTTSLIRKFRKGTSQLRAVSVGLRGHHVWREGACVRPPFPATLASLPRGPARASNSARYGTRPGLQMDRN